MNDTERPASTTPQPFAPAPPERASVAVASPSNRSVIESLYARHASAVFAVALGVLPRSDAEDVVQEVFVKAMNHLAELRDPAQAGPWLAAIARHAAIDRHRRSARDRRTIDAMKHQSPAAAGHKPASTAPALDADDVLAAVRRLPEAYREPLLLRLVEGLTGPQIAQQLDMTHGSVRVNLSHGMQQLRQLLGWAAEGSRP